MPRESICGDLKGVTFWKEMSEGKFFHPMTSQQNGRWYICKWSSLASQPLLLLHNTAKGKVSGITAMRFVQNLTAGVTNHIAECMQTHFTAHALKCNNSECYYNILLQHAG